MKYELVLLCSFVAGSLFGQYEYQPLVEEGATWSTGFACDYCGSHPEFYTISGDTILDGTPYKKLMYAGSWVDNGFNFEYDYLGGIREDSLRRVYYKGENLPNYLCCDAIDFSQELLMYDFGVEVGDTIFDGLNCYYFPPIGAGYRVVDQIDTIEIGGDLRKRFTLRWVKYDGGGTCCDYHIEGLGYEYGFFPFCIHFEWTWITACHTDSSMDYDITPCLLFSECYARGVSTQEVKKSAIGGVPQSLARTNFCPVNRNCGCRFSGNL
jgi:hypothetical protein